VITQFFKKCDLGTFRTKTFLLNVSFNSNWITATHANFDNARSFVIWRETQCLR